MANGRVRRRENGRFTRWLLRWYVWSRLPARRSFLPRLGRSGRSRSFGSNPLPNAVASFFGESDKLNACFLLGSELPHESAGGFNCHAGFWQTKTHVRQLFGRDQLHRLHGESIFADV